MNIVLPLASPGHRITKRGFWDRFPIAKEVAMRAVILAGSPAVLAASLQRLQVRVDASPYVDLSLQETQDGVSWLASAGVPEIVTIDGSPMPLRLTSEEAASILSADISDKERWLA